MRSGKTYLDFFRIPKRIRRLAPADNAVIMANTCGSAERNLLAPMRILWGDSLVGRIKSDGRVRLFGKECYVIGADKKTGAERLQGMSMGYCYGDEITTWSEDVFRMVQSRLDREGAVFDGTCNPDVPGHWFKRFLDSGGDIYSMNFTIDDNPALSPAFVKSLKAEYEGTVYYNRFILGRWCAGTGAVYRRFAENKDSFILDRIDPDKIIMADVGVDFGGNGSAHAFNLTGYTAGYEKVITLDEFYSKEELTPCQLEDEFVCFIRRAKAVYPRLYDVYCDSAEQVLIRGLKNAAAKNRLGIEIHNAVKGRINDRIHFYSSVMGQGRYFIMKGCVNTIDAFLSARYDAEGNRCDDGSSNIDSLDAQEYSTEKRMNDIINIY